MDIYDNIKDILTASFSDWIKINDNKSGFTIENFPYTIGVDEKLTKPHCALCVSVNNCYFKNEDDKKPIEFGYDQYNLEQIPFLNRGLYHPRCHCKKIAINKPTAKQIEIIFKQGKIDWLLKDKIHWIHSWGYKDFDVDLLISNLILATKEAYLLGSYQRKTHDKYGFKISLYIKLKGINDHQGEIFNLISSCMIFPNGKLKINTFIGGKIK